MKYIKLLAFTAVAAVLASCDGKVNIPAPEIDYNTASATVAMAKDQIAFKENKGLVDVPFTITGETNGAVTVVAKVTEYTGMVTVRGEEVQADPAMADVHYFVTSLSSTVEAGVTTGSFEISLVDDLEINEPRAFEITLVEATGATLGAPLSTIVVIRDNDSEIYDKLAGKWYFSCKDYDGASIVVDLTFDTFDEEEKGYEEFYVVTGSDNFAYGELQFTYHFDKATGTGYVGAPSDQVLATLTFNGLGDCDVIFSAVDDSGDAINWNQVDKFAWNEDFTELTLMGEEHTNWWLLVNPVGTSSLYIWETYKGISKLTREKPAE